MSEDVWVKVDVVEEEGCVWVKLEHRHARRRLALVTS
jgi:hypothetical protein